MGNLDYKEWSRRRRPHFQPPDTCLFVTFRLAGSIPKSTARYYRAKRHWFQDQLKRARNIATTDMSLAVASWLEQIENLNREWFIKCEQILHQERTGPTWMRDRRIADKVAENLHSLDGDVYRLDAFSVMSNHVHTIFKPFLSASDIQALLSQDTLGLADIPGLSKIMQALKGRSARECNLILGRSGSFWEHESFDRAIRKGKFEKTVRYVLNNPVKVGAVKNWQAWPWNYCRKELRERFE